MNSGETAGDYNAVLKINSMEVSSKSVSIPGGNSASVNFQVTRDAGSYEIEVGGQKISLEFAPEPVESSGLGFWWILIGLGIVLVVVLAVVLIRRKAA